MKHKMQSPKKKEIMTSAQVRALFTKKKPKASRKKSKSKRNTNQLTNAVIDLLNLSGFKAWRQNNTAIYDKKKDSYRAFSGMRGVPDIIGIDKKTGGFLAVEIKTGTDTLSDEQIVFIDDVNSFGGFACECRCPVDLEKRIKEYRSMQKI